MTTQKVLLPYNYTHLDQKALDFVIHTFGGTQDVAVTVFNAYTPITEIETDATSVTGRLKSSLHYLLQKIKENEKALDVVKDKLIEGGLAENQVNCVFRPRKKDIASEIVDLVKSDKFDTIVLNRKHARVTRFFSSSTSHKVIINLKGVTVCVVS
jgi:hypothetical protein